MGSPIRNMMSDLGQSVSENEAVLSAFDAEAVLPWSPSPIEPPPFPGSLGKVGNFALLRFIGQGGMGIVYLARPIDDLHSQGRQTGVRSPLVALKILKPQLARDPRAVQYFRKEAHHMRQLRHRFILPVLEFGQLPQGDYLAMPYLKSGSLSNLARRSPLSADQIARFGAQIASALQFAHSRGIIHRDLKPRNILLDAEGDIRLTDFGLSHSLYNDSLLEPDQQHLEGSAPYLSPRAARGECEDTRSDIYAFGAVLYEMLTRRPPYEAATREEVLRAIAQGPPPPIRTLNPQAAPSLVTIAEGAMARQLHQRYVHMDYILADFERVHLGLAPFGPAGPAPKRESFVRRFKLPFSLRTGAHAVAVFLMRELAE
jgi:eukaryotic-like serine/threonine-protein kinase